MQKPPSGIIPAGNYRAITNLSQHDQAQRSPFLDAGLTLHGRADRYHKKQRGHAGEAVTVPPHAADQIEVSNLRREAVSPGKKLSSRGNEPLPVRVLMASGNDQLRSDCRNGLASAGYVITTTDDGIGCLASLREESPDLVILDSDLLWGGADGVLAYLQASPCGSPPVVLLMTGSPQWGLDDAAAESPIVAVLEMPVTVSTVLWAVRAALSRGTTTRRKS